MSGKNAGSSTRPSYIGGGVQAEPRNCVMTAEEFSDRLWNFAVRVACVVDALPETRMGRHIAGQLVRCGTSAPPNYDEACSAESRADFVHKIGIATKGNARDSRVAAFHRKTETGNRNRFAATYRRIGSAAANANGLIQNRPSRSAPSRFAALARRMIVGAGDLVLGTGN